MNDYIVTATAANHQIRAIAITGQTIVEHARQIHNTSPVVTAALGRLLMAGAMMGSMMKGDKDILTLKINSDGPIKGITVTADGKANVKGFAYHNDVMLPPNALGKLDVGGAVGHGMLSVIKDLGLKEPYVGQVDLQTGEIAEDLTYYFATSEQVPSCVGLGVLMEKDNTVKCAGGFILQLLPFAEEEVITKLEQKIQNIHSVTAMLEKSMKPEDILEHVLGDFGIEYLSTVPTQFACNCSQDRIEKALASIGKKDLDEMIAEGKPVEMKCYFCNHTYEVPLERIREIRNA